MLETKRLYAVNGVAWPSAYNTKVNHGLDAYYQFLSPDGKRPAIGDAYRNLSAPRTMYTVSKAARIRIGSFASES